MASLKQTSAPSATAGPASLLFIISLIISMIGIFAGIFFLFTDPGTAIVVVTLLLVGGVGILSFLRHSIYYRSDQARMGWSQEHPEFQIEVGFANLAIGLAALIAIVLNMGPLAYGMTLLIYALYLLCTLVLHAWEALYSREMRKRAIQSTFNTGLFTLFLLLFAVMAFMQV
jgi:hypothetical protein